MARSAAGTGTSELRQFLLIVVKQHGVCGLAVAECCEEALCLLASMLQWARWLLNVTPLPCNGTMPGCCSGQPRVSKLGSNCAQRASVSIALCPEQVSRSRWPLPLQACRSPSGSDALLAVMGSGLQRLSCAYLHCMLCVEGRRKFITSLTRCLPQLHSLAAACGLHIQVLCSTSASSTEVRLFSSTRILGQKSALDPPCSSDGPCLLPLKPAMPLALLKHAASSLTASRPQGTYLTADDGEGHGCRVQVSARQCGLQCPPVPGTAANPP